MLGGQVRASIDYQLWKNQYQIGVSSLFIHALGMVPYKDTFWTSRLQPDNKYSLLLLHFSLLSTDDTLSLSHSRSGVGGHRPNPLQELPEASWIRVE